MSENILQALNNAFGPALATRSVQLTAVLIDKMRDIGGETDVADTVPTKVHSLPLAAAAATFAWHAALNAGDRGLVGQWSARVRPAVWPYFDRAFMPTGSPRDSLIRAAALAMLAVLVLDRGAQPNGGL